MVQQNEFVSLFPFVKGSKIAVLKRFAIPRNRQHLTPYEEIDHKRHSFASLQTKTLRPGRPAIDPTEHFQPDDYY